ncbi:putative ubiquitin conjugation factor E4 [Tetrabaena socialis]|uniref:Putative ubiquitin conjugation factor E4 n=1 Tax=Tetrabaena socialis TaxID=47790 RepID=A0A2J8AA67_9CHLO|nr:putative ubiquitin conjugation factor E4 [Tetrabaena socialis]|eukprot:PNH09426.1 putative ubiquitin conjugation factor E4 [Tetrabaena socialis]
MDIPAYYSASTTVQQQGLLDPPGLPAVPHAPTLNTPASTTSCSATPLHPTGSGDANVVDVLDRALIERLIESPPQNAQPPMHYLMNCYQRASDELRQASSNAEVQAAVQSARELILNYAGLTLFAGMVPQPAPIEARGPLQLLDALLLRHGLSAPALATAVSAAFPSSGPTSAAAYAAAAVAMPAGFLEALAARHASDEGLADAAARMVVELSRLVVRISPLGDPAPHLSALAQLVAVEPLARAAVASRHWLPDMRAATGRAAVLPGACWLGPFFAVSPIPDDVPGGLVQEPSVAALCFSRAEQRRPGDVNNAVAGLRLSMKNIIGHIHGVTQTLLKTKSTKAAMISWLGAVLDGNAGRSKLQVQAEKLAPDGFLANVAAVLLKSCGPFLDPSSELFWRRVDPGFVAAGGLLDASYAGETRLAAASDEEAAWRERLRSHSAASASAGGAARSSPMRLEYFVEDMCTALIHVSRYAPQLLSAAGVRLEDFAQLFTALMASPKHVRSAFLRSRLSEVLEMRGGPWRRAGAASSELASLFACQPLVVAHLAPVLLRLYNDIEHTERQGAFYFKFSMRVTIANILKYLWGQPQHRAVWLACVEAEGYRGQAERFASMLINDATYLLDEVLKQLKLLRQAEETRENAARWAAMSPQAATTRTLLLPHMVRRLADTLNYFLKYLVGPERRQLRIRQPEKYNFHPKQLLRGLVQLYLHVDAVDLAHPGPEGPVFAAAVGQDVRSFQPENFMEAVNLLESSGLLSMQQRAQFEALAQRAVAAGSAAEAEDEEMGADVPEDFTCGIMASVMKDPVLLPSGVVVDRPNILRHLLSDPTDPFNRKPLEESQLVAAVDIADRIRAWRAARKAA